MNTLQRTDSLAKACKDLMLREPFYGLFLISLNKVWTDAIPTAGVGIRGIHPELAINPEFWDTLNPEQHKGLLKHELLHIAFFHITDWQHLQVHKIANIAMDIEINQYIDLKTLPTDPEPLLPESYPELKLEPKQGTQYYYDKLTEAADKNNANVKAMVAAMGEGALSCTLLDGSEVAIPKHEWEAIEELPEATQRLVKAQVGHVLAQVADSIEKSRGTVPGEIKAILKRIQDLEPPKFDWKGYMRRFAGRSIKIFTKKSRRKLNKRLPDFPGLKIKQQKHILVAIDTSGSVNTDELKEFLNEIYHMKKTGSEVTIIQCDTAISFIGPFDPKKDFEIHGRGGTDFQPVIDYYNEYHRKYSCMMYLTDGEAPAPNNAKGNILWVLSSISTMNDKLPGTTIQLN